MKWNGAFLFERQQTVFRSFAPAPIPQRVSISLLLYNKEWNTPPPLLAAKKLSLLNNGSPQEILLLVVACQDTHEFSREVARQFQLEKYLYSHTYEDTLFYRKPPFYEGSAKKLQIE